MSIITAFKRLRQEDLKFEASLSYLAYIAYQNPVSKTKRISMNLKQDKHTHTHTYQAI
jgi:hypothetical protein